MCESLWISSRDGLKDSVIYMDMGIVAILSVSYLVKRVRRFLYQGVVTAPTLRRMASSMGVMESVAIMAYPRRSVEMVGARWRIGLA